MLKLPMRNRAVIFSAVTLLAPCPFALANHGPGASGGGSSTISGETLKPGSWELSIREDYTEFEKFSAAQAIARAQQGGDFDALKRGFITTLDIAYGVIDDLQVGGSIGYFAGQGFISSDAGGNVGTGDPNGLTDMVLLGKYRFMKGEPGNLALVFGVKLPTGRDDFKLNNGERLSPTDQPGTGAIDIPVGLGYSRFLTPQVTVDASVLYTVRTEHDDFKVGNRFDAGLAVSYRVTPNIKDFPQFSVFGEALFVHLDKDKENGEADSNSGSDTLYLSPGVRVRINPNMAVTVAPAFPVLQEDNGNQGRVDFKLSITLSFSF
jgi:hypothetical protein